MKYQLTRTELAWSFYDVGNSAFSLIVMTTMFPFFYADYVLSGTAGAAATSDLGFANSLAGFAVALSAPFLGALADNRNARKTGLLLAVLLGAAATLSLACLVPGMKFTALTAYGLGVFAFTAGNVFYDSMLSGVTTPEKSDYVSSFGFAVGYLGSVIPFLMVFWLYTRMQSFPPVFLITTLWWAAFSVPLLLCVKLPIRLRESRKSIVRIGWDTLRGIPRLFRDRNTARFLLAYFCYIDGVDTVIVMAVPYGVELGMKTSHIVLTVLGIQLIAFPCSFLYGALAAKFGAKKLLLTGIGAYSLTVFGAAGMPYLPTQQGKIMLFLVLALLIAVNQGGIQALSRSCYSRIIPPEKAAEYFGFYNIFGKFATVIGPALVALSGKLLGGTQFGFLSLLALFGAGAVLLWGIREKA